MSSKADIDPILTRIRRSTDAHLGCSLLDTTADSAAAALPDPLMWLSKWSCCCLVVVEWWLELWLCGGIPLWLSAGRRGGCSLPRGRGLAVALLWRSTGGTGGFLAGPVYRIALTFLLQNFLVLIDY